MKGKRHEGYLVGLVWYVTEVLNSVGKSAEHVILGFSFSFSVFLKPSWRLFLIKELRSPVSTLACGAASSYSIPWSVNEARKHAHYNGPPPRTTLHAAANATDSKAPAIRSEGPSIAPRSVLA